MSIEFWISRTNRNIRRYDLVKNGAFCTSYIVVYEKTKIVQYFTFGKLDYYSLPYMEDDNDIKHMYCFLTLQEL